MEKIRKKSFLPSILFLVFFQEDAETVESGKPATRFKKYLTPNFYSLFILPIKRYYLIMKSFKQLYQKLPPEFTETLSAQYEPRIYQQILSGFMANGR